MRPCGRAVVRPALGVLLAASTFAVPLARPAGAAGAGAGGRGGPREARSAPVPAVPSVPSVPSVDATETAAHSHAPSPTNYQPEAGLTFLVGQEPRNWNPHAAGALGQAGLESDPVLDEILAPVLPSVFVVAPGYKVELNTAFVSSARQTRARPQTVVYEINPQAVWSDGSAITYQDFVYNWQAQSGSTSFTDLDGQPFRAADTDGYRQIASVSEVGGDPYRVKVVFKKPDRDWRALFSLMIPAHVADQVGFDTGFTDPVADASGGPFEVQSYVPGSSLTLVRNPRYWGAPANLAQVTFRFVTDSNQVVPSFEDDDVGAGAPAPAVGLEAALSRAVSGHHAHTTAQTPPQLSLEDVAGPLWEHLDFNERSPLLADAAVRRAIMMAIDRPRLMAATIGRADPSVRALGSLVFVPGQVGYRNDAGVYGTGNIAGARSALIQAGYAYQGHDITYGGAPAILRIVATAGDPVQRGEERVIASQLAGIGITVTVTTSTNLLATLRHGAFDLALEQSEASPFLGSVADRYQTDTGSGAGAYNFDDYSSATTDRLLAQAAAATNPAQRVRLCQRIDGQLWSDAVSLPLYQVPQLLVFDKQYRNLTDSGVPGGVTWNMAQWGVAASS